MRQPCDVQRGCRCNDAKMKMNMGTLTIISVIVVIAGIAMIIIPLFSSMTALQSSVFSSVGIPLFIFGLVMFGIMLAGYAKKVE